MMIRWQILLCRTAGESLHCFVFVIKEQYLYECKSLKIKLMHLMIILYKFGAEIREIRKSR